MSVKAAGTGHFQIPTAPAALTAVAQSASANTLGSAVSFGNAPSTMYITGVTIGAATTQVPTYVQIQILVAASIVASVLVPYGVSAGAAASVLTGFRPIFPPIPVASGAAITVKSASSVASAVNWGVSLECIAQSNVVDDGITVGTVNLVNTVTTVTNQLTAAAIATGVWQDATAGDFTVASSIGKSLYINNVAPGASGGHFISGTNAGTTTFGALTVTGVTTLTGNVVLSDGLTISAPSTGNRAGLDITGNGTGSGVKVTGGATGIGLNVIGGGTSGDGIKVTTTSGHGLNLAPVGTDKHGFLSTGGNGGTSDGIKAAAGTGGVDFRANQTGNLTGTVATLTTYTGNTPQTGDAYARLGAPAGASVSVDVAAVKADTAAVKLKTDNLPAAPASTTNITAGTITTVTNLTNAPTAGDFTATMKTSIGTAVAASAVASVTGNVGGNVTGSIGSLGAQAKLDVNAEADTALSDVGVTSTVTGRIDAAVSTRLASASYTAPLDAAGVRSALGLASANLDTQLDALPTAAEIRIELDTNSTKLDSAATDAAAAASDTVAIKAKTDSLAFTVAGRLDVNVLYVNGVQLAGAGIASDSMRPA